MCLPLLFIFLLWAGEGRRALHGRLWMWVGWALVMALYCAARYAVITAPPGYVMGQLLSAWQRWPELLSDIGKLLLPVRLQVLAAPGDVLWWPGAVVVAIVGAACFMRGTRRNVTALALAFVMLPLLMSLLGASYVVLETRLYLPAAGMCVLLAEALRAARLRGPRIANTAIAVVAVLSIALCIVNLQYVPSFQDRDRFSQAAIKASPNSGIAASLRFKMYYHENLQGQR